MEKVQPLSQEAAPFLLSQSYDFYFKYTKTRLLGAKILYGIVFDYK